MLENILTAITVVRPIRSRQIYEMVEGTIVLTLEVAVVSNFTIFKETRLDNCIDHIDYRKALVLQ